MSCRTHPSSTRSTTFVEGSGRSGGISLLPQFNHPVAVHDFALENRPPQLPSRNSPLRLLGLFFTGVFCMAGVFTVAGAAVEPLRANGEYIGAGMSSMVASAISSANAAAERHAQKHYAARAEYLERRGMRRMEERAPVQGAPRPNPEPLAADDEPEPPQVEAFLLRMAALRASTNAIDHSAVQQYFPSWTESASGAQWNQDAVLRDLVLAVSELSHRSSVVSTPLRAQKLRTSVVPP